MTTPQQDLAKLIAFSRAQRQAGIDLAALVLSGQGDSAKARQLAAKIKPPKANQKTRKPNRKGRAA